MSAQKESKIVVIGGKKLSIADVKKSFADLEFLTKIGAKKIIAVLLKTQEPLTREQIAQKAGLSTGYTIQVLNELKKYDYVVDFRIGKRKTIYYALTEQGFDALAPIEQKTTVADKVTIK
jgi:ribosomal protein S25